LLNKTSKAKKEPDFLVLDDKKEKPKSMTDCHPEFAFFLSNGNKVNNIHELGNELEEMPDKVFDHHVNEEKNDFSSWVSAVFEEKELAKDLKKEKSKKEHHRKVLKHVVKDVTNYIQ